MKLFPAEQEFSLRTLSALAGPVTRLDYLAGLRDDSGNYRHWGFARTYGERTAAKVLAKHHQQVMAEVLRTPIPSLWSEVVASGRAEQTRERLARQLGSVPMAPAGATAAERQHLHAVVTALVELLSARSPGA
jgi:hypothetical protein